MEALLIIGLIVSWPLAKGLHFLLWPQDFGDDKPNDE